MSKSSFPAAAAAVFIHFLVLFWAFSQSASSGHGLKSRIPAHTLTISLIPPVSPQTAASIASYQPEEEFSISPDFTQPSPTAASDTDHPGLISTYFPAKELTKMPVALTDLDALQPAMATNGMYGKLAIRLWLNESGHIDRLSSVESDLPKEIEASVLTAFGKMLFRPGEINAKPVKTWVEIVIEYGDKPVPTDLPKTDIEAVTAIQPT